MSIEVIHSGLSTTIQDLGRYGYQKHGVIVGGAMDPLALRIANLLVGNYEREAAIEVTLIGPKLLFHKDTLIAICGGDLSPTINDQPISSSRPVLVRGGSVLKFGHAKKGCRTYVAIAGGVDVPEKLGSRSTYLRAGLGGFKGRALKEGDRVSLRQPKEYGRYLIQLLSDKRGTAFFATADWSIGGDVFSSYRSPVIRVIRGPHFEQFTEESRSAFFEQKFQVTPQSDRMGYRLSGPLLSLFHPLELISEAVSTGTIQVPPNGHPIILMADRQTTGGYAKIGYVASIDLPLLAQLKPGEKLSFREVTMKEAQQALIMRETMMKTIKRGIELMVTGGSRSV